MVANPLAEVFGFMHDDVSEEAKRYRKHRLCPFHNKVPNCTKDKVKNPLGVCSIYGDGSPVVICPIRFRENWTIVEDAAEFFFPEGTDWTSLVEVRLKDKRGKSAGNIDMVLVAHDGNGRIIDYGALEVQAVYISGNLRDIYDSYISDVENYLTHLWDGKIPRPDYLSSSRKRLAPQLIFKGGILKSWGRKTAVALNAGFYGTLPKLPQVNKEDADIAWFVYSLVLDEKSYRYTLKLQKTLYTEFAPALSRITESEAGDEAVFMKFLEGKLRKIGTNKNTADALEDLEDLVVDED